MTQTLEVLPARLPRRLDHRGHVATGRQPRGPCDKPESEAQGGGGGASGHTDPHPPPPLLRQPTASAHSPRLRPLPVSVSGPTTPAAPRLSAAAPTSEAPWPLPLSPAPGFRAARRPLLRPPGSGNRGPPTRPPLHPVLQTRRPRCTGERDLPNRVAVCGRQGCLPTQPQTLLLHESLLSSVSRAATSRKPPGLQPAPTTAVDGPPGPHTRHTVR